MILSIAAAAAIAAHLGSALPSESTLLSPVQYCGNGYDIDIYGRCYPNGVIPPQYQAARRGRYGYGGGRYPVPCGNGADTDLRDGLCYPNGTVPPQFQSGRQGYYYYGRPRRGYY
jgi:hypothetical protein